MSGPPAAGATPKDSERAGAVSSKVNDKLSSALNGVAKAMLVVMRDSSVGDRPLRVTPKWVRFRRVLGLNEAAAGEGLAVLVRAALVEEVGGAFVLTDLGARVAADDALQQQLLPVHPSPTGVTSPGQVVQLELRLIGQLREFDEGAFIRALSELLDAPVHSVHITKVAAGSVVVTLEGEPEEVARLLDALSAASPARQRFARKTGLATISWSQDGKLHSVQIDDKEEMSDGGRDQPVAGGPLGLLQAAIKAIPQMKYALGVVGMGAAAALALGLLGSPTGAVVGVSLAVAFSVVLVVFAKLAQAKASAFLRPALILLWSTILMFPPLLLCLFTSFFFGKPLDFRPLQPPPPIADASTPLKISDLQVVGVYDDESKPANTADTIRVSWNHSGDDGEVVLRFGLQDGTPGPETTVHALDGHVDLPAAQFKSLWPDPSLYGSAQLSVVAQASQDKFRFGPFPIQTALIIVALLETTTGKVSLVPKTADLTMPVAHDFDAKCLADAPHDAPVADRIAPVVVDVQVRGSRGKGVFPRPISADNFRCVYLGNYPKDLVRFTYLHD